MDQQTHSPYRRLSFPCLPVLEFFVVTYDLANASVGQISEITNFISTIQKI